MKIFYSGAKVSGGRASRDREPEMAALPAALLALLLPAVVVSTPSQTNCTDGKTSGPCGPRRQLCGPLYADALPAAAMPRVHLHDRSCHLNDPSGPVWDPVHGFYHVFYQVTQPSDHSAHPSNHRLVCWQC
jgi:hypothetical protein